MQLYDNSTHILKMIGNTLRKIYPNIQIEVVMEDFDYMICAVIDDTRIVLYRVTDEERIRGIDEQVTIEQVVKWINELKLEKRKCYMEHILRNGSHG